MLASKIKKDAHTSSRFFNEVKHTYQANVKKLAKAGCATFVGLALTSQFAMANNPAPRIKVEAPNVYIVKKGDTLWDISSKYLKQPWRWKEIWATNRQIKNPHRIWPGDKLILCIIQGKRMVGIDDGEGCAGLEKRVTGKKPAKKPATRGSIRYEKLSNAVPTLPLSAIRPWLYSGQVVDPIALKDTPYVIASKNKNIITGAGDKIYVRGPKLIIGQEYGVYRIGKAYVDPYSGANLGQEVFQVASGVVTDVQQNGVSSVELQRTFREEVREGDKVFISLNNNLPPLFHPKAGSTLQNARIIRVHGSLGNAAKNSVVVVNIGQRQGAQPGQVFAIYRKGALIRDDKAGGEAVRMPSERAGMLMVFKTFDQVSYAYVLETDIPVTIGDELQSPVGFDE